MHISASGANVEAIKVDDGAVVFDETLTVTGACTFESTVVYKESTEVVAATNVITAAESGKTFFLNHATEFTSTLPAPAAGLYYKFFIANNPEAADFVITTNAAAAVIH